jgi:hypothetical protein
MQGAARDAMGSTPGRLRELPGALGRERRQLWSRAKRLGPERGQGARPCRGRRLAHVFSDAIGLGEAVVLHGAQALFGQRALVRARTQS